MICAPPLAASCTKRTALLRFASAEQRIWIRPSVNLLCVIVCLLRSLTLPARPSFANAKPAEDAVEQIVGVNSADHFAKLLQGAANLQRDQLRRLLLHRLSMG